MRKDMFVQISTKGHKPNALFKQRPTALAICVWRIMLTANAAICWIPTNYISHDTCSPCMACTWELIIFIVVSCTQITNGAMVAILPEPLAQCHPKRSAQQSQKKHAISRQSNAWVIMFWVVVSLLNHKASRQYSKSYSHNGLCQCPVCTMTAGIAWWQQ